MDSGEGIKNYQIKNAPSPFDAAQIAIKLIKNGDAHILAKGKIKSNIFLKAILDKEYGLKVSPLLSKLTLFEMVSYHKLIGITDIAIIPKAGLKEKIDIINNSYPLWYALGIIKPKVAVLAAVEVVIRVCRPLLTLPVWQKWLNEARLRILSSMVRYLMMWL